MKKITYLFFTVFALMHINAQTVDLYSFSQNSGSYSPLTGATILATQTIPNGAVAGSLDDVNYTISLPFNFNFNGLSYTAGTNMYVNTNGFVSFGATAPTAGTYGPIGSTNVYDGAISAFGLDANGGYAAVGSNTSGSPILTVTSGTTTEYPVGAIVAGTGIPAGSTVVSTTATTITISNNCTSTGTNRSFHVATGEVSYLVSGTAPNQKLTIQYKRFRPYNSTLRTLDFQIVLNETSNVVEIVYGNAIGSSATSAPQVGLRGTTNSVYNNRTSTTSWASTTAGTSNTQTITYSNTIFPASGLTFVWSVPVPCAGTPTPGNTLSSIATICYGGSTTLSLQNATSGTGVTYQWYMNATPIGGANSATYVVNNITSSNSYYCAVTCSGNTTDSNALVVGPSIVIAPVLEPFATFLPSCWLNMTGGDLTTGPTSSTGSGWGADGLANNGTSGAIRNNIFSTGANDWVVSPVINIPTTGYELKFEAAAVEYNVTTAPATPWEADDSIEVLIATGGSTTNWTVLHTYNDTNQPGITATPLILDLDAYIGQNIRVAFRAVEGAVNGSADIDFSIDNFEIRLTPSCDTTSGLVATAITNNSATVSWSATTGAAG